MKTNTISGITGCIVIILFAYFIWTWGFCRFYVGADQMAIVTSKDGRELPSGQILADPGQKGILREPLGEGRHFLNPIANDWKIVPVVIIPAGKVGIVTAKDGKSLPPGEFLADEDQKGIWKNVLGPGKYRLNPEGYDVTLADAVNIPIGYVGVVTSLSGKKAPDGQFAGPGEKGVRKDILQPGLYYINPNAYKIDVLEIGLSQVALTGREGGQVVTKNKAEVQNAAMDQLASNVLAKQLERRKDYMGLRQQAAAPADNKAPAGKALKAQAPQSVSSFGLQQFVERPVVAEHDGGAHVAVDGARHERAAVERAVEPAQRGRRRRRVRERREREVEIARARQGGGVDRDAVQRPGECRVGACGQDERQQCARQQ